MKTSFFSSFKSFMATSGNAIVFTGLFYTFWLVINLVSDFSGEIRSFSGRMIGVATMNNVDVGARVSLFYKSIFLFFGGFSTLMLLGYFIAQKSKNIIPCNEVRAINYISIAGLFLFVFKTFDFEVYESLELIYFLHKLFLASIVIRLIARNKNETSVYVISIIIIQAIAFYYFIADINNFLGNSKNPDFYIVTFCVACLLLIGLNVFLRQTAALNPIVLLRKSAYVLLPLIALPFLSILKDEVYLVFKANTIVFNNQLGIYLVLLFALSVIIFFRHKKSKNKKIASEKKLLQQNYFPVIIFSLAAYVSYNYYAGYYDEIFESGNVYLPIMEHRLFGTLSPVEKLNTHLLSDYFFSYLYAFFNGLKINEITLYDFFLSPICYTLYYFLIRFLTRNGFVAICCVLLFPFAEAFLPEGYCFAILGIFAIVKAITKKQSLKNYIIYFCTLLFLISWRIDLGYNCLLTMPLMLLYYHYRDTLFRINWKLLFKAAAIVVGSLIVLMCFFSICRQNNLFSKIPSLLNYCMSAQSYGYHSIGDINDHTFKMHYFIFPAIVIIIMMAMLIKHKQFNRTNSQRIAYLSLLFLCLFYLFNFNRGLIRHSLFEGSDGFVSSFVFIIIASSPFVFFKRENNLKKYLLFFGIGFLLINVYRVPEPKGSKSVFEKLILKISNNENIKLSAINSRVINAEGKPQQRYKQFSDFIFKNTKPNETFIEFSNRPMLYFFTGKECPSWFYQTPLCIQNDFLQEKFIEDIANYKTPYLLFSGINENGYDDMDGVPNQLRHYKMAEYFYNNFKPYIIVDNFCLWRNNKAEDINKKDTIRNYVASADSNQVDFVVTDVKIKPGKVYSAKLFFSHKIEPGVLLSGNGKTVSVPLKDIDETTSYAIIDAKEGEYKLSVSSFGHGLKKFLIIESDYIPDYTAERILNYNFEKLPYVWGTYDKKLSEEKVWFEKNGNSEVKKEIQIPKNIDRTNGNTLILTCKNNTDKVQKALLQFGNRRDKNKTGIWFDILPSKKEEKYAIRISCIYKWYSGEVDQISLLPQEENSVIISNIKITEGK